MAGDDKAQEKTEEPTEKKKEDARKEGQVAQSRDLASVGMLLALSGAVVAWWPRLTELTMQMGHRFISAVAYPETYLADPTQTLRFAVECLGRITGPILATAVVAGFGLSAVQVGLRVSTESFKFDMKVFDPVEGLKKKLFSIQSVVEWLKSMAKVVVVGLVAWKVAAYHAGALVEVADYSLAGSVAWTGKVLISLVAFILLFMLFVGIADYLFQRWETNRKMMMTKQEIRDESKDTDGNPEMKGKMRQKMKEMGRATLVADVGQATVVVTNPTHYAVAIKYDIGQPGPPMVVARGGDERARLIKDIARSKGIPRVENRPLARALYAQCKPGQEVPGGLYETVAEVLAWVYRLRASRSSSASGVGSGSRPGTGLA